MKLGIGHPKIWSSMVMTLAALSLVGACCKEAPPPRTVFIACNGDDAGVEVQGFEDDQSPEALGGVTPCARACKNLAALGCPESAKLPGGKTCVETCKSIAAISSYDPLCVEKAKDVAAVRKCPQVRCMK